MRRFVHVIDRHAATWSALGAIEHLQRHADPSIESHDVIVRGRMGRVDRTSIAGIETEPPSPTPLKRADAVIVWDDESTRWRRLSGVSFLRSPKRIPIDIARFRETNRSAVRDRLQTSKGEIVVAFAANNASENDIEYAFIRASALALAGCPATWIALDAPPLAPADLDALRTISDQARVQSVALPPWSILAACDFAVFDAEAGRNARIDDLIRWAEASGACVITPSIDDQDDRRRRFEVTRELLVALDGCRKTPRESAPEKSEFQEFVEALLEEAIERASVHS